MTFRSASFLALIPVFLALTSLHAEAATIGGLSTSGYLAANSFPDDTCCGTFTGINKSLRSSMAYASNTIDLSKAPRVSAVSTANPVGSPSSGASESTADLFYNFIINSPDNVYEAPILIEASGTTSVGRKDLLGGNNDADVFFNVSGYNRTYQEDNYNYLSASLESNAYISTDKSFNYNGFYTLPTNSLIRVEIEVATTASASNGEGDGNEGPASAFASVDPYFALDPNDKDLSLTFSAGINNVAVSAVPLPASAPLFGFSLIGLSALGYGFKRRGSPKAIF